MLTYVVETIASYKCLLNDKTIILFLLLIQIVGSTLKN